MATGVKELELVMMDYNDAVACQEVLFNWETEVLMRSIISLL